MWVALRASLRIVLEGVTLADLASGELPAQVTALADDAGRLGQALSGSSSEPAISRAGARSGPTQTTSPSRSSSASASPRVTWAAERAAVGEHEVHADLEAQVRDPRRPSPPRAPSRASTREVQVVRAHELAAELGDRPEEAHHEVARRPLVELARRADLLDRARGS